jgi:magnesium-transporting ATPase (P-type)
MFLCCREVDGGSQTIHSRKIHGIGNMASEMPQTGRQGYEMLRTKSHRVWWGGGASTHLLLKDFSKYKDIESRLTLVGIVGIKDPARPEVTLLAK